MTYIPQQEIQKTAFGETAVANNIPFIQAVPVYGLIPANFREYTASSGTTGVEDKMFTVTTGTSAGGYGAIQSFRSLNYKAGEACLERFTALFQGNVANSWQGVGLISIGDELSFGYDGTTFGIWHRSHGLAEVRTLTVTAASGTSVDLTLTLNGVAYTIPITSGDVQHNAYEIAKYMNDNATGWGADQLDDTVILSALSDSAKSGAYSATPASGTFVGTIAQDTAGVAKTSTHIPQASWNRDTMPTLDPSKGNVYQINYQYLGFGDIYFSIEDKETGQFKLVHIIKYANTNTIPSLGNPNMKVGMYAASITSTTDLKIQVGSFSAFIQGFRVPTRNPRGFENTQASVPTTMTNILTLRNRRTYNGYVNQVEIQPILVTVSSESSRNSEVEIRTVIDDDQEQDFQVVGTNLVGDVDVSPVTFTSGKLIDVATIAANSSVSIDLQKYDIKIPPQLKLVVQARVIAGTASDISAAVTWREDI